MGSLLGFRPPQFSEDTAWLPDWLQHVKSLDDSLKEDTTPSRIGFEFLQHNISLVDAANPLSTDEGGYKSCHLFLSGDDSSPLSLDESSDNGVRFQLHLSPDGNTESTPSSLLDKSQAERFESNHTLTMQPFEASAPEEKANEAITNRHALVANITSSPEREKSKEVDLESVTSYKTLGERPDIARSSETLDINDAVELSIAASEALVIHEIIKSEPSTDSLPTSAVLEAALLVKQARLDFLDGTSHYSVDEISGIDFLPDLDESTMAEAYDDVGLSVSGTSALFDCDLLPSQVKDTLDSENHIFDAARKHKEHGVLKSDCSNVTPHRQLKDASHICKQFNGESESACGFRQKNLSDDCVLDLDTNSMASQKVSFPTVDVASYPATVSSSPQPGSPERDVKLTKLVSERFQSRWLGGWTCKVPQKLSISSAAKEHRSAKSIPKLFANETSFLSESADIAPDENSFVEKQDLCSNIASESSMPVKSSLNNNGHMLSSEDIVISCSPSLSVDPLCSVVPCSISSENAYLDPVLSCYDTVQADNCLSFRIEQEVGNLQRISNLNTKELAVCMTNGEGSLSVGRRQLNSLKSYSMIMPRHDIIMDRETTDSGPSFPRECNRIPIPSVVQIPVTDLTKLQQSYVKIAKDGTKLAVHMEKEKSSPLILTRRAHSRIQALKHSVHNFNGQKYPENLEQTAIPEGTSEIPHSENLQKLMPRQKIPDDTPIPARKRVCFLEPEMDLLKEKKVQKLQTTRRNSKGTTTTRVVKRSESSNPWMESRVEKETMHSAISHKKNIKKSIFQNIKFLLTGFTSQKEKDIKGLIKKCGGLVLSDIPSPQNLRSKRSSRLICQPVPVVLCSKKLQTIEFLYGCAVNACLLKVNWLTDSIAAGYALPPNKYSILPHLQGGKFTRVGKTIDRRSYIFDNVGIMLHGKPKFCSRMSKVIKLGGGQVFKTLQWLVQSLDAEKVYVGLIVVEDEGSASRHLKHCALEQKIHMLPATWIVKSLQSGKLLPFMENNHSPLSPIQLLNSPAPMELSEEI